MTDVTSKDLTCVLQHRQLGFQFIDFVFIRCNVNGLTGTGVSTLSISAGTTITYVLASPSSCFSDAEYYTQIRMAPTCPAYRRGRYLGRPQRYTLFFIHPLLGLTISGPVQVYVAKAPSTAATFDGQGSVWTKIYSSGLLNSTTWATDVVNANSGRSSCSYALVLILMRNVYRQTQREDPFFPPCRGVPPPRRNCMCLASPVTLCILIFFRRLPYTSPRRTQVHNSTSVNCPPTFPSIFFQANF